jgi:hypothetical protein
MRILLLFILWFWGFKSFSQELILYSDTLNGFTIGMPQGWIVQTSKTTGSGVKLFVREAIADEKKEFLANYNVNLVPIPNSNIDSSYVSLKASVNKRSGYQFISEGDTTIEGVKYRWLLEKHANSVTTELMSALILLGYKNGTGYMVSFVTGESLYPKYELLFKRIAATFRL